MDTTCEQHGSTTMVEAYLHDCPARTVLAVFGDKWALLVLGALRSRDEPVRFNELRRLLSGVTQKMLTRTLRTLERNGLVSRTVYPTIPPKVEYRLTELGLGAGELTAAFADWSDRHLDEILAARARFDELAGQEPQPVR
jgi:DNA-binding HxlR family transcriptional regulator